MAQSVEEAHTAKIYFSMKSLLEVVVEYSNSMDLSATVLLSYLSSTLLIFGGILPYIPQYLDIKKSQNAEGFSLYVCLALLVANSLRILFWFGHPFELPLLIQSILMNITMFAMIELCVRFRSYNEIIPGKPKSFTELVKKKDDLGEIPEKIGEPRVFLDFNYKHFWAWTDFYSYVEFMATFSTLVGVCLYLFIEFPVIVEGIGLVSALSEAMLGVPQFYKNFLIKSTLGMSKKMVLMWTVGDILKTIYFVVKEAPFQFLLCGLIQVTIDLAIMLQVVFYKAHIAVPRISKPVSHLR